jgi:hypothetical protein
MRAVSAMNSRDAISLDAVLRPIYLAVNKEGGRGYLADLFVKR